MKPVKTLKINATDSAIKRHSKDECIKDINDPRFGGVLFRYHKDRSRGSWHLRKKGKWKKLGNYPAMTIKDIEQNLAFIDLNLACGAPLESAVVQHWDTVSDLLSWYLERVKKLNASHMSQHRKSTIKSAINRHLIPLIGALPVLELDKPTLDEKLIIPTQEKLSDSFLGLVFGVLSTAYLRARELDLIPYNPLDKIKLKQFGIRKNKPKPCAIRKNQVADVLESALKAEPQACFLVLMMLMHGTRIGETRMASWDEFDLINKEWVIPEEHTKGDSPQLLVPLSSCSLAIIARYRHWQKQHYKGNKVFHKPRRRQFNGNDANELIQAVSGNQWQSHDLRKRFRSSLTDLNVDYIIGESLINHKLPELAQVYIDTQAQHIRRAAVERHHEWLQGVSEHFYNVTSV